MKKAEKVQDGSGNFLESPFKHVFYHLRLRLHKIRRKKLWVKRRVLGFISEVAGGLGRVKYQNGRRGPLWMHGRLIKHDEEAYGAVIPNLSGTRERAPVRI